MSGPAQISRVFQLWRYEVSHSKLWLMSKKDDRHDTRVSIVFKSVRDLCLSEVMFVNAVRVGENVARRNSYLVDGYPVVYQASTGSFVRRDEEIASEPFVVAGAYQVIEDDLEYFEAVGPFDG